MNPSVDVAGWRVRQRQEMLARRAAVNPEDRKAWNRAITRLLVEGFPCLGGMVVSFCWPFKAEFDARHAVSHFREHGAVTALPVVLREGEPMEFRAWTPEAATAPGVFGLPVPQATRVVRPDALLIPPVGFGSHGYRLGYGGGYFDRTLAGMAPQPLKIAVAFEVSRMPTIYPQPHDIPMDFVVTERGIHYVSPAGLALVEDLREVRRTVAALSRERSWARSPGTRERDEASARRSLCRAELVSLLNTLLEAERAVAKALSAYLKDCDGGTVLWRRLNTVQRDGALNCSALEELIRGLGARPATGTGVLLHKALLAQRADARLQSLNRAQKWGAKLIRTALPHIDDPIVKPALRRMLLSHVVNIDRCGRLIGKLTCAPTEHGSAI